MKKFTPTKGQQHTLDVIAYFGTAGEKIVKNWKKLVNLPMWTEGAVEDRNGVDATQAFIERNDKGVALTGRKVKNIPALARLMAREAWCGRMMEVYQEGILDGSMPYIIILDGMPRFAVDYLKRNIFRSADAELIERVYQQLLEEKKQKSWWNKFLKLLAL